MGGQNVLQLPGQDEPLSHHGVPAWRYDPLTLQHNAEGKAEAARASVLDQSVIVSPAKLPLNFLSYQAG